MQRFRQAVARAPHVWTAVALFAVGIFLTSVGTQPFWTTHLGEAAWSPALQMLTLAVTCAGNALLGTRPALGYTIATIGALADSIVGLQVATLLAWSNTIHVACRTAPKRVSQTVQVMTWGLVALLGVSIWVTTADGSRALFAVLQVGLFVAVALWWSMELRTGDSRIIATQRRAAAEQQELLQADRAALATHLHDTLCAHLASISMIAQGARLHGPGDQAEALDHIEVSVRAALCDVQDLLAVLRINNTFSDVEMPRYTIDEVLALSRRTGLDVAVLADSSSIPHEIEWVLAAIMRESLTNALKHGDGTAAVHVSVSDESTVVQIVNPIRDGENRSGLQITAPSTGIGLGAMAACARQAGGTFRAGELVGCHDARRWETRAEIPLHRASESEREGALR